MKIRFFPARDDVRLGARLKGVSGFTGRGQVEYARRKNGGLRLKIELQGVGGKSAEIIINGEAFSSVPISNGVYRHSFDTRRGARLPTLEAGANLEIRQNGELVLEGRLTPRVRKIQSAIKSL